MKYLIYCHHKNEPIANLQKLEVYGIDIIKKATNESFRSKYGSLESHQFPIVPSEHTLDRLQLKSI